MAVARGALALSMCAAVMGTGTHSNAALAEALRLPCCDDLAVRIAELEARAPPPAASVWSAKLAPRRPQRRVSPGNRDLVFLRRDLQRQDVGGIAVYAEHGFYQNFNVSEPLSIQPDTHLLHVGGTLTQTDVRRWGFSIEQRFAAAATIVYAQARLYDPKIVGYPCEFLTRMCAGEIRPHPPSRGVARVRPWRPPSTSSDAKVEPTSATRMGSDAEL
jgi:hypothetical protein